MASHPRKGESSRLRVPRNCAELPGHSLWWTEPAWLRASENAWLVETPEAPAAELLEARAINHSVVTQQQVESDILLRFPTLHRLLRATARCVRWRNITTKSGTDRPASSSTLQPAELNDALFRWMRIVQAMHYPDELSALAAGRTVSHRSHIARLTPFLDDNGVLRVGGRLKHAIMFYDKKHPMIAPPQSWLTQLIVSSCHLRTLHGGVQLTLAQLRLRF